MGNSITAQALKNTDTGSLAVLVLGGIAAFLLRFLPKKYVHDVMFEAWFIALVAVSLYVAYRFVVAPYEMLKAANVRIDEIRAQKIANVRAAISDFHNSGRDAKSYLEGHAAFLTIRPYLSKDYFSCWETADLAITVRGRRAQFSEIVDLENEMDRLERVGVAA